MTTDPARKNHQWLPVGSVPVRGTPYDESVWECVNCKERRTTHQMACNYGSQECRWANLDPDEPITLPDDPRLRISQ